MSSNRPYQSHFLSFLSRQTQKLKDQAGLLWRNLKLAGIWGAQLVLYPIYAVFQASRLVGKQLGQVFRQTAFQMQAGADPIEPEPVSADSPIQNVLTALQQNTIAPAKVGEADGLIALLAQGQPIQGVASLVTSRRTVLVTPDNQVLDILTSEQQHKLNQRIIFEIALYWRYWRSKQIAPAGGELAVRDRATMAAPLRLFWQLMAWIQTSPVAIATNLFHEAELTGSQTPVLTGFMPNLSLSTSDRGMLTYRSAGIRAAGTHWLDMLTSLPQLSEVPDLIQAAIRYFFGGQGASVRMPSASAVASLPGRTYAGPIVEDPWLTVQDLFGAVIPMPQRREIDEVPTTLFGVVTTALPGTTPPSLGTSFKQWIQAALPATQPKAQAQPLVRSRRGFLKTRKTTVTQPATIAPDTTDLTAQVAGSLDRLGEDTAALTTEMSSASSANSVVMAADWLEAKATTIGYERTLLEKIVDFLDRVLVAIEQFALKLWDWLGFGRKTR